MHDAVGDLRARLIALLDSVGDTGTFLLARAGNAYCLRSIRTTDPLLSIVLKGRKRIRHDDEVIEVLPGHVVAVAAGSCMDVENIPDPECGEYLAALLLVPEEVLNITRALLGEGLGMQSPDAPPCRLVDLETIVTEVAQCIESGGAATRPRFHHALSGLLLKLHELGIGTLLKPVRPRLADSISVLLAKEPARDWRSVDLEDRLAMSGATLRRQLAAEQTSLREILSETRLGQALQLLQSTRLPVKTVAARAGYRSVSSFVRRFRERYGVEPSRVANADVGSS